MGSKSTGAMKRRSKPGKPLGKLFQQRARMTPESRCACLRGTSTHHRQPGIRRCRQAGTFSSTS